MTTTIHPSHAANLVAKADRLARFLHTHDTDHVAAELLSDAQWERIAGLAGERTPSPATRAATVTLLRSINAREAM